MLSQKGFSLIEFMIALAIIGLLAALSSVSYKAFVARARQSEAKSALSAIFAAEHSYRAEYSTFTACLYQAGYEPTTNSRFYTTGLFLISALAPEFITDQASGNACDFVAKPWGGALRTDGIFSANRSVLTTTPCTYAGLTNTVTANGFSASGVGSISENPLCDVWTINENRILQNDQSGL